MQQAIQAEVQQALSDYARAFPRRAHPQLLSCRDISSGWEGELLCVQLGYAEEGQVREDEFVLKLYAGDSGPQKARREFRALRWLAGVGYPAPQALFASAQDAAGRAYVAMERIVGETVAHLLETRTGRQRRALIRRCCRLYADLHALDWEPCRELCGGEQVGEGEEVVQAWLRQVRAVCQQRLPGVFEPALDWLQERSQEVVCRRVCYLHGDFHFNNVMLREDGRLVVIDWTGPLLTDYRFDVGWSLLLLRTQGRAHLAGPLLADYQRRAGRPVEHLAFFEAAACCRRLFDLVCSAREGAAALGMKPEVTGEIAHQGAHARAVYARLQACTSCVLPRIEAFIAALTEASAQVASVRPTVLTEERICMRSVLASPVQQGDSLIHRLHQRAVEQPEDLAYTFLRYGGEGHDALTYAQLDQRARAISAQLRERGAVGRPVLLLFPSGLEYIAAYFGCLYAGAIAVPAYVPHSARDLPRIQAIAVDAGAEVALTTARARSKIGRWLEKAPALAGLHWIASDALDVGEAEPWQERRVGNDDLAFLQYTSGSTAAPRGVMVSHGNLMQNLAMIHAFWRVEDVASPVGVYWLPIFHDMGLIMGILAPLYSGYPVYFMSPADFLQRPLRWLQAIAGYRGTFSSAPNFAYELCVQRISPEDASSLDLSSWRGAGNAAEPVRLDTLAHFLRRFSACGFAPDAFRPAYGLAEATLVVTGQYRGESIYVQPVSKRRLEEGIVEIAEEPAADIKRLVGCGRPIHGQQIIIVDPQTRRPCAPACVGEIWVRGPSVALGYWNRPQETAEVFQAHLETGEGPFLRTGDLGVYQHGHLLITGRLKDVIILDGRNLYPQDIEQTVDVAHPAIRSGQCAAFSCDVAGRERLVVLAEINHRYRPPAPEEGGPDAQARTLQLDLRAIVKCVRRAVSEQHGVRVHEVVLLKTGGLLKTSSGKLQRRACRQAFLQGTLRTWQDEQEDERP